MWYLNQIYLSCAVPQIHLSVGLSELIRGPVVLRTLICKNLPLVAVLLVNVKIVTLTLNTLNIA